MFHHHFNLSSAPFPAAPPDKWTGTWWLGITGCEQLRNVSGLAVKCCLFYCGSNRVKLNVGQSRQKQWNVAHRANHTDTTVSQRDSSRGIKVWTIVCVCVWEWFMTLVWKEEGAAGWWMNVTLKMILSLQMICALRHYLPVKRLIYVSHPREWHVANINNNS